MKEIYKADWNKVREKFNPNLLDKETLSKVKEYGFWGKAFTTEPTSLSNVIIIQRFPEGKIDVSLEAQSEEEAEALLGVLKKDNEYFFAINRKYPWRKIIERKISGSYVGKKFHYRVSKENFEPQIKYEVIELSKKDKELVEIYLDEEGQTLKQFTFAVKNNCPCFGAISEKRLVSVCCTIENNIMWVHTLKSFRNKDYGKSVVSKAVMDILQREDEATYDADDDNIASIKLCKSLGFKQYDETLFFIGSPVQ